MIKKNINILIYEFLEYLKTRNYSNRTVLNYNYQLKYFTGFLKNKRIELISQIDKDLISKYQQYIYYYKTRYNRDKEVQLSTQSQICRLTAVKSFFNYLEKKEIINKNPTRFMELPKIEKRLPRDILSPDEINKIMIIPDTKKILGYRDRTLLETIYSTGIRRNELLNLKLFDIDFNEQVLFIRKGKNAKDRLIPIGQTASEFIKQYIEYVRPKLTKESNPNNCLFLSRTGKRMSSTELNYLVKGYVEKAGIKKKINCHSLRSSMATSMLKNGADIIYIQKILGHSRPESTQIYTQVDITDLKGIYKRTHPRK